MKNLWVRLSDFQVVSGRAVEMQIELSSIQLTASLENNTGVTEFILRGTKQRPTAAGPPLDNVPLVYLISVVANLGTIQLIPLGCRLRTRVLFLSDPVSAGLRLLWPSVIKSRLDSCGRQGHLSCSVGAARMFFLFSLCHRGKCTLGSHGLGPLHRQR